MLRYGILSAIQDIKTIELNAQILARQIQPKQKTFEFIEPETEKDTAFGVPIDRLQEHEI